MKKYNLIPEKEKKYNPSFLFIAIGIIQDKYKKDNKLMDIIECPKCNKKLHYTISKSNGHIWGKCETKDCLIWAM